LPLEALINIAVKYASSARWNPLHINAFKRKFDDVLRPPKTNVKKKKKGKVDISRLFKSPLPKKKQSAEEKEKEKKQQNKKEKRERKHLRTYFGL
jgi:hypothetical protein